jgi:hypothetical protein
MQSEDVIELANLMIQYDWSLRVLSDNSIYGKSHIHRVLTQDLRYIDDDLYVQCKNIMKKHKEEILRDRTGKFIKRN